MGCGSSKPRTRAPSNENTDNNVLLNTSLAQTGIPNSMDPLGVRFEQREAAHSLDPGMSHFSVSSQRYQSKHQSKFVPSSVRTPSVAPSIASSYVGSDDIASLASGAFVGKMKGSAAADVVHDIPPGCNVVDDATLIDPLTNIKGAEVYRAESERYGLILAKVVSDADAETITMFENELKILSFVQNPSVNKKRGDHYRSRGPLKTGYGSDVLKYQHDNVIGFVGYMEASDELSRNASLQRRLLTEFYVDTLRDHIAHRTHGFKKDMQYFEAALYLYQVAKGLYALHKMKVCHRDLNTENVIMGLGLLDREYKYWLKMVGKQEQQRQLDAFTAQSSGGRMNQYPGRAQMPKPSVNIYRYLLTLPLVAKIANFGHATRILSGRTTTVVGSMQFMAPEMMRGQPYDDGVDIWSFGCIMYEMVAKKPPFHNKTVSYIESRVTQGKFPKSEPVGTRRFRNLEIIMRSCLRSDPTIRCRAKQIVEDLGKPELLQ